MVRYTTDFDIKEETNWWFCIKDTPLDIASMKTKRRYELNKGYRYFYVKEINPLDYKDSLFNVYSKALKSYGLTNKINYDEFVLNINKCNKYRCFAAFSKDNDALSSYALCKEVDNYIDFASLKTNPEYEHLGVNAAIVRFILEFYDEILSNGGYIDDGERAVFHRTHFQDYLIKYFGFRKAYCKLHIVYNRKIRFLMKIIYRFRKIIYKLKCNKLHTLKSMLIMDEISRES